MWQWAASTRTSTSHMESHDLHVAIQSVLGTGKERSLHYLEVPRSCQRNQNNGLWQGPIQQTFLALTVKSCGVV